MVTRSASASGASGHYKQHHWHLGREAQEVRGLARGGEHTGPNPIQNSWLRRDWVRPYGAASAGGARVGHG